MLDYFKKLFAYNHWANREALASLRLAELTTPQARELVAHMVGAERLWLGRLKQEKTAVEVWPELTLEGCEAEMAELARAWQEYLDGLTAGDLLKPISYVNTRGEPWTNMVQDILMQVILHSAYHRGQIAIVLRSAGQTPVYTDFIHCVRQGFLA